MRLARLFFNVRSASQVLEFYTSMLGMERFGAQSALRLGYSEGQALLSFSEDQTLTPYRPAPADFYWKIGITVRNLDHAVAFLQRQGWPVSEPRQFRDIGYLCHLQDPEGLSIELLQHGFQGNEGEAPAHGHPVGAQAILAHLTLRVADIASAKAYFGDTLGMRLMSVQPVPERGFCLYFFSWSDEPLPEPELEAVGNREWLWARPYTLVELQHLEGAPGVAPPVAGAAGFAGLAYGDDALTDLSADEIAQHV